MLVFLITLYHQAEIPLENSPVTGENVLSHVLWKGLCFFHVLPRKLPNLQTFVAAITSFHITLLQLKFPNFNINTGVVRCAG